MSRNTRRAGGAPGLERRVHVPAVLAIIATLAFAGSCTNGDGNVGSTTVGGGGSSGLVVIGGADLAGNGPEGGPFTGSVDYTVSNQATTALQWIAIASDPWIQVSSGGGLLLNGESSTVTVSIDAGAAANLPAGSYFGSVVFRDQDDPAADVIRPAALDVQTPASTAPTLSSLTPFEGPATGGNLVTVAGSGFMDGTPQTNILTFGGVAATDIQVIDDATLTCIAPPGEYDTTVDVLYTNDNGSGEMSNGYGYNRAPTVDAVSPASGPAGGGNVVTLDGSGFQAHQPGVNVVTFGGLPAANVQASGDATITCEVPPGVPGTTVDVALSNANGQALLPGAYAYAAPPVLISVTPASGPEAGGNTVTLRGTGFQAGGAGQNQVTFGAAQATNVVVQDDTTLSCTVPAGSAGTTVDVGLSNANGAASLTAGYAYQGSLSLTSVAPQSGPAAGGTAVTLTGSGFQLGITGPTTVSFGGSAATSVLVVSDTTLTCVTPGGAPGTSVDVVVSNSSGTATLPGGFGYQSVAVGLTAVAPASGPASGGNTVTVTGTGLQIGVTGPTAVTFGGNAATNVVVVSDSTLTCRVPAGTAGASVAVAVSNSNGSATLSNGYSYNAAPTVASVAPSSGPASGGNTVTLTGSGFQNGNPGTNLVTFGGVAATSVVVVSDGSLTCRVPAGTAGASVAVAVSNSNGSATLSNGYSYNAAPTVTGVAPSSGPASGGNTVTLSGSGFQSGNPGTNGVTIGGMAAANVVVVDDATLRCSVPAGTAGSTVAVSVSNANGSAVLANGYAYNARPTVTSVTPSSGPPAGGNGVTLSGSGFLNGSPGVNAVSFGGNAAGNVVVVDDATITCDAPAGVPGTTVGVQVVNANGTATLSNGYRYRGAPTLTAVSPTSGPPAGGNRVTLSGSGFQLDSPGPNTVTFGGAVATNVVVASDTSLACDAPAGAGGSTVDVTVANANGADTLANAYTYAAPPALTGVSPSAGPAAGGNTVTLSGSGFQNGNPGSTSVTFGGAAASNVVVANDSTLTCAAPAGTAGATVAVAVTNANGTDSLPAAYSYYAAPDLASLSPTSGPSAGGTVVTLSGSGFQNGNPGAPTVRFGTSTASSVVVLSDTTIRCNAPAGTAGNAVDVVVSNANGSDTLFNGFAYHPAPTLTAVTPSSGPSAGGNTVSVSGSGFANNAPGTTSVSFGGVSASNVVVSSDTTLTCQVPAGPAGSAVLVDLSNANGSATLASAYAYEVAATVVPGSDFTSSGDEGGPFSPQTAIYALTNTGSVDLDWAVTSSDTFVTVDAPGSGILGPGQTVNVTLRLAAMTALFTPGLYSATATFTNVGTGEVLATRGVELTVNGVSAGWTDFTPSADTRMIYVSSSQGNDSNDGLSQATPKRTLAAGRALLRNGFPDWLLLRRGDTWTERFGVIRDMNGRSATERMLIGTYGPDTDPRPLLRTGSQTGIELRGTCDYFAVVGLHFIAHTRDGSDAGSIGVSFASGGRNMLLEDCYVEGYATNVVVWGDNLITDFEMRRCVVVDAFSTGGHSQGMFTGDVGAPGIDGLLIEECLFDHNGWREGVPGAEQTVFNHNLYLNDIHVPGSTQRLVLRKNVIANASATGCQARGGGIVDRNIFVRNPVALDWGIVTGGSDPLPGGVTGQVTGNVFLESNDIGSSPRGGGMNVGNVASGTISDNVIAHYGSTQPYGIGMDITGDIGGEVDYGVHNLTVEDNLVYDWAQPLRWSGGTPGVEYQNIVVRGNNLQNPLTIASNNGRPVSHNTGGIQNAFTYDGNTYYSRNPVSDWFRVGGSSYSFSGWLPVSAETNGTALPSVTSFSDPDRSLGSYRDQVQSTSGSSLADCLAELRQQRKGNWRPQYETTAILNYVRTGFDLPALAP